MTRSNIHSLDEPSIRMTPLLSTLFQAKFGFPPVFQREIHPHDEMLRYSIESHNGDFDRGTSAYFYSGIRACQMTQQLIDWRFGSLDALDMLDFASGYGRVTRFLLDRLGPRNLTISDVMPSAVDFQRTVFGVNAVVSSTNPADLILSGSYHIVQAISLFSHLPKTSFRLWLSRLWECVKPGGLLIFTVHDMSLRCQHDDGRDFIFSPASENQDLEPSDYGTTWVSESFVSEALGNVLNGFSYTRLPRGLNGHQDVYAVVREEHVDFASLEYRPGFEGFVESAEPRTDGCFSCSGWAASIDRSQKLERVDLLINDEVVASCSEFSSRPDVAAHFHDDRLAESGWELSAELPKGISHSHDVVMIVATGAPGMTILAMGCIHSLVADCARANLKYLQTTFRRIQPRSFGEGRRPATGINVFARLMSRVRSSFS